MGIGITGIKIGLSQIAKMTSIPGTASTAITAGAVVGEITAAKNLGKESRIYIPIYGETGIDAGIVGYTSATVGFLAALGTLAAALAGAPVAAGVGVLAIGIGVIAAAVNPALQDSAIDVAIKIGDYLKKEIDPNYPEYTPDPNNPYGQSTIVDDQGNVHIDPQCRADYNAAQNWAPPPPPHYDPLTLDLDNDGIEITAASSTSPTLFDVNADGIKTSTAWVKSDDGLLVFDRNGNGSIDNGSELFGDSSALSSGDNAADGFAALAQEDTNQDGNVDSQDANWSQLRVWRDLNQDGTSQADELFTLDQLGITSLGTASTDHSQTLADGSRIGDLGSFTRADGTTGTMADADLVQDTFFREFTDDMPVSEEAAALPDMQGSGKVRDLRQAANDTCYRFCA